MTVKTQRKNTNTKTRRGVLARSPVVAAAGGVTTAPVAEAWQDAFKASALRPHFSINLTAAQLEFLSAVADGVQWDRALFGRSPSLEHVTSTAASLLKRGLIQQRDRDSRDREFREQAAQLNFYGVSNWELTPAGVKVVDLVVMTGLFVEADAAIAKRVRQDGFSRN